MRAEKIYHDPLMKAETVEFKWNSEVSELVYDKKLTGIRVKNKQSGEQEELLVDGFFISIGRAPVTELFRNQVDIDEHGYIVADESTRTSAEGVFAIGDVRTKTVRQIVTAVADGAVAVHFAQEYVAAR